MRTMHTFLITTLVACISSGFQPAIAAEKDNYSCAQLRGELQGVASRVTEIAGVLSNPNDEDASGLSPPLVVFWSDVLFSASAEQKKQLLPLKERYDDLLSSATAKKCTVAKRITEAYQRSSSQSKK